MGFAPSFSRDGGMIAGDKTPIFFFRYFFFFFLRAGFGAALPAPQMSLMSSFHLREPFQAAVIGTCDLLRTPCLLKKGTFFKDPCFPSFGFLRHDFPNEKRDRFFFWSKNVKVGV